jgi:hypothetical protein
MEKLSQISDNLEAQSYKKLLKNFWKKQGSLHLSVTTPKATIID